MERFLVEVALRSSLIATATAAILWLLRVKTAPARHAAWTGVLALMLLLPVWTMWGPKAPLRVLPAPALKQSAFAVEDVAAPAVAVQEARETRPAVVASNWDWPLVLLGLYLIGAGWLLARLASGTMRARRLSSAECVAPITVGLLKPRIILPEDWESWPQEQLEAVLTHERAHARRRDPLVQWFALLNRAIFWFHPLAWWLERKLAALAEEACDAAVLEGGHDAGGYAECLLAMERNVGRAGARLAIGMAMPGSALPKRIVQIFEGSRPRVSRWQILLAALTCSAAGALFAAGAIERMPQVLPLPALPAMRMPQVPVLLAQSAKAPAAAAPAPAEVAQVAAPAAKLEFEVASVKRNTENGPSDMSGPRRSGNLVVMHNTQLYSVIHYAYHLKGNYQMVGFTPLPRDWNWYDIEARTGADATDDQVRLMLQSLLEDRFKLKVHRETREIQVYDLTIAKGGPKLAPSKEGPMTLTFEGKSFTQREGTCGTSSWIEGLHTACHAADMAKIAEELSGLLAAPVAEHTGLTGTYDLQFLYIPDDRQLQPDAPPGPSLTEAVQSELGLKLEKGKGPVEVTVIDHLEKPSEN